MNRQKDGAGIEWTRAPMYDGSGKFRDGYTWNPVAGCRHGCEWHTPDGTAECYAKTIAERFPRAYPKGFAHDYWHPHRLNQPLNLKEPAGIFLDSMSDLMSATVDDSHIELVLNVCSRTPRHIYFLLTKNPKRLSSFWYSRNVWVGVSSPPDVFFGKPLTARQKERYMRAALQTLTNLQDKTRGFVRWISFEPLTDDWTELLSEYRPLQWFVIGAVSSGARQYPVDLGVLRKLLDYADSHDIPVFYKGNMRQTPNLGRWRSEFPDAKLVGQLRRRPPIPLFISEGMSEAEFTMRGHRGYD